MAEESKSWDWKTKLLVIGGCVGVASLGLAYLYKTYPKSSTAVPTTPDKPHAAPVANNNKDKVVDECEELSSDPLEKAIQLKNRGNKFYRGGKFDKAIECYSEAVEVCPKDKNKDLATFYQNRAAARESLSQFLLVEEDCTKALNHDPMYEKALARRAKAREKLEKFSEALEDITAVCIIEGFTNTDNLQRADRVLKAVGRVMAKEAMKTVKPCLPGAAFLRAFFSAFNEDPVQVEELGEDTFSHALKAFKENDYEQLLSLCNDALASETLSPARTDLCLLLKATLQLLSGQNQESKEIFDKLINSGTTSREIKANALIKRGSLRMQNVNPSESFSVSGEVLSDFDLALSICPDHPDVFHHRGQMMLIMDRTREAVSDLSRASQMRPSNPIPCAQRAYAAHRTGDPKALEELKKLCTKFSQSSEVHSLYGQALVDTQNFTDADKVFETVTQLEKDSGTAHVHRGLLRLQAFNDIDGAIQMMQKAIEVEPKCEFALETLATVEVQRGNLEEATKLFERAIKLTKTEAELGHLISLREAALTQLKLSRTMGLRVPSVSSLMS